MSKDNLNIDLYSWVPFFVELSQKIDEIGKQPDHYEILREKSVACFGSDSPMVSKNKPDPLTFIYSLAQKNTTYQKDQIFTKVKANFELNSNVPTDWIFPTPSPNTPVGFYSDLIYEPEQFWQLHSQAVLGELNEELFNRILKTKNVGVAKLTQILFLINPYRYIPVDRRLLNLPVLQKPNQYYVRNQFFEKGLPFYGDIIGQYKNSFPGCDLFEINLFASLISDNALSISNTFYQIGSNVYGGNNKEEEDYFEEFYSESAVWVGGPTSGGQKLKIYPIFSPVKGDIILSHFNHMGNGIGIVLHNQYQDAGKFDESFRIKVVWLNKTERAGSLNTTQMMGFSRAGTIKESFEVKYPETFKIIIQLSNKLRSMEQISNDSIKNLIFQGAPGTGKTRLAQQLALYLQTENSSLTEFLTDKNIVDQNEIFHDDPTIDPENEQIKLILFHPSYTYEDFVRGIVTKVSPEGKVCYKVEDKILIKMADKAIENPDKKYVLIIDEINRANLPSVLGELIFALEYRGKEVTTIYEDEETGKAEIELPNNLYFIGTMNTADRSTGHIDYAIRRRFVFRDVPSELRFITEERAKNLYIGVESLFSKDQISPDFLKQDIMVGHSYFLTGKTNIEHRLELEIKPLLREYVKDGILIGEDILEKIENLTA